MSPDDLEKIIAAMIAEHGLNIGTEVAAKIAHRSKQTIYDWSSRGRFDAFRSPHAGPIVLDTAGFVRFIYASPPDDPKNGRAESQ